MKAGGGGGRGLGVQPIYFSALHCWPHHVAPASPRILPATNGYNKIPSGGKRRRRGGRGAEAATVVRAHRGVRRSLGNVSNPRGRKDWKIISGDFLPASQWEVTRIDEYNRNNKCWLLPGSQCRGVNRLHSRSLPPLLTPAPTRLTMPRVVQSV